MRALRLLIYRVLIFVLVFEQIAWAAAESKQGDRTIPLNAYAPSEVIRQRLEEQTLDIRVSSVNEDQVKDLENLILSHLKSKDSEKYEKFMFSESEKENIKSIFVHFYNMIGMAKNGHFNSGFINRDRLIVSLMSLSINLQERSEYIRPDIKDAVLTGVFQWGFASLGPVQYEEKKRVDFILNEFYELITNNEYRPYLKSLYSRNYTGFQDSVMAAFAAFGLAFMGFVIADFSTEAIKPLMFLDFIKLSTYTITTLLGARYIYLKAIKPIHGVSNFIKLKVETTMESYLKYDYNLDILRRLQHRIPLPTLALPSSKPAVEVLKKLNEASLKEYFTSKVAEQRNVQDLFMMVSQSPKLTQTVEALIAKDPDLTAKAELGNKFRESYHKLLNQHFGEHTNFVMDPELQILRDLIFLEKTKISNTSIEIKIKKAEELAWEETKIHFSLPFNMELSELESSKYDSDRFLSAYTYFKKRFFILQQNEVLELLPSEVNVEEFKENIRNQIHKTRILNFKRALQYFQQISPNKTDIKIQTLNGSVVRINLSDLLNAEIEIQKSNKFYPSHNSKRRLNKNFLSRVNRFGDFNKSKDHNSAQDYYRVEAVSPIIMRHQIIINLPSGPIVLSEASFSRLLYELGPEFYSFKDDKNLSERYLTETSRRDAILANTLNLLLEVSDRNSEELQDRLRIQISQRSQITGKSKDYIFNDAKTLTEEIRDVPETLYTRTALNGIRWDGYRINPNHWRVRDEEAKDLQNKVRDKIEQLRKDKKNISEKEKLNIEKSAHKQVFAKALGQSKIRHQSAAERTLSATKFWAYSFGTAVSVVMFFAGVGFGTFKVLDWLYDNSKNSGSERTGKNESKSGILFQLYDPKNNTKEKPKESSFEDSKKTSNESLESILSKKVGEFSVYTNMETLPTYLNFATLENLPPETDRWERQAKYHGNSVSNEIDYESGVETRTENDKPKGDIIEIITHAAIVAKGTFLPIPTPSGFKVYNIELIDGVNGRYVDRNDYTIYFSNRTGLNYARLAPWSLSGSFQMEIQYERIEQLKPFKASEWSFESDELIRLNKNLHAIKATELATTLDQAAKQSPTLNILNIDSLFYNSSMYTYTREGVNTFSDKSNPFANYQKFLKDGVFFYQCTGSNALLRDYLNSYYKKTGSDFQAYSLLGFVMEEGGVSPIGHQHTLATQKSIPYSFVELDATPVKMDPEWISKEQGQDSSYQVNRDKKELFKQKTKSTPAEPQKPKPEEFKTWPFFDAILPKRMRIIHTNKKTEGGKETTKIKLTNLQDLEILIQNLKAELDRVQKITDQTLNSSLPELRILGLIKPMRTLMIKNQSQDLIQQLVRVRFNIPLQKENASIQKFISDKITELNAQHSNDNARIAEHLITEIKAQYQQEMNVAKNDSSNKVASDLDLQKSLNSYLEFILNHSKSPSFKMNECARYFH